MTRQRITQQHMQAQVDIVNRMLGFPEPGYNQVGQIQLSGAYGGWTVHHVTSEGGGVRDLLGGHGPARECSNFLSGMIAGLRLLPVIACDISDHGPPHNSATVYGHHVPRRNCILVRDVWVHAPEARS